MDKRLNIHLFLQPNCTLVAVDNSDYSRLEIDLSNHIMLEFLSYNDENSPLVDTIKIRQEKHNRGYYLSAFSSEFALDRDGTYAYYKLVIPTLNHFIIQNDDNDVNKLYSNLYAELFYYNNILYKSNLPNNDEKYNLSYILDNSTKITNYIDAYNFIQNGGASQTFYCPKEFVFSVCKLQRCLISLQEQLLFSNSGICSYDKCTTDESLRNRRDFLMSALYVFDYLKDIKNFTEAQRILDNLSSCNSICGDELNNYNNGCGCGSSV